MLDVLRKQGWRGDWRSSSHLTPGPERLRWIMEVKKVGVRRRNRTRHGGCRHCMISAVLQQMLGKAAGLACWRSRGRESGYSRFRVSYRYLGTRSFLAEMLLLWAGISCVGMKMCKECRPIPLSVFLSSIHILILTAYLIEESSLFARRDKHHHLLSYTPSSSRWNKTSQTKCPILRAGIRSLHTIHIPSMATLTHHLTKRMRRRHVRNSQQRSRSKMRPRSGFVHHQSKIAAGRREYRLLLWRGRMGSCKNIRFPFTTFAPHSSLTAVSQNLPTSIYPYIKLAIFPCRSIATGTSGSTIVAQIRCIIGDSLSRLSRGD